MPNYKMVNELIDGSSVNTWVAPAPSKGLRSMDRSLPMMAQEEVIFASMIHQSQPVLETPIQRYRVQELMPD